MHHIAVGLFRIHLLSRADFIRYIGVDFTFGLLDCVRYNGDFVISRFVIPRFCSIHFTVTLAGLKNILTEDFVRGSLNRPLNRGSSDPFLGADQTDRGLCIGYVGLIVHALRVKMRNNSELILVNSSRIHGTVDFSRARVFFALSTILERKESMHVISVLC